MKTRNQMAGASAKRIAKRPPGSGKGPAPTMRAPITGKAAPQAVPQHPFNINSKARSNTSPGTKGKRVKVDGTPTLQ